MRIVLGALLLLPLASGADFPQAEIKSKTIAAKLYLPDAERGYYRGTRFDWAGQIYSLRANDHEYFGQWFERYDPKLHDAIMGPVQEFRGEGGILGYAEAKPGDTFMRIGIGMVRKPDDKAYAQFKTYEIVDPGKWKIDQGKDWIRFTHELSDGRGYSYRYEKTIRLANDKPVMTIEHTLKNTGQKEIRTQVYDHNFFVMDNASTGPDSVVKFPFDLKPTQPMRGNGAEPQGQNIVYSHELNKGESVYGEFAGFGPASSDYDIHLENKKAGAGVEISGDQPLAKLVFWSIRTTFCPEPYIEIGAAPGKEFTWKYQYRFYNVSPSQK